jgi:hypothetical protein
MRTAWLLNRTKRALIVQFETWKVASNTIKLQHATATFRRRAVSEQSDVATRHVVEQLHGSLESTALHQRLRPLWSRPGENFTRGKFVERRPKISDAKRKTALFLQRRASLFSVKELSLRCFPQITAINTPSFKDKGTSIKVLYVTTLRIIVSVVSS